MGKEWLSHIVSNGSLRDNQVYAVSKGSFTNLISDTSTDIYSAPIKKRASYQKNELVWGFLKKAEEILEGKKSDAFTFRHHEYEHNSEDPLITVKGFEWSSGTIQTGNVVGSINQGDLGLKVTSRFGDEFLKYIISDADGFLEIKDFGRTNNNGSIHWLLIFLWKIKLKKAFRLGLPKVYETRNERLHKVKGNIDVVDFYINGQTGRYKSTFREHTYLTHAGLLINETIRSNRVKAFVSDIKPIVSSFNIACRGQKITRSDMFRVKPFKNPFYSDYNEVIELSKRILLNEGMSIGDAKDSRAFLFDVSMLFEYFIKKLLIRNGKRVISKFSDEKTIQTGVDSYERKLQPDLLIEENDGLAVFDVKYKRFDERYGVKREDLFQIHTYVGQHGNNDQEIKRCGFIYPSEIEREPIKQKMNIMRKSIPFEIYFLHVPRLEGKAFFESFKGSCIKLISQFS